MMAEFMSPYLQGHRRNLGGIFFLQVLWSTNFDIFLMLFSSYPNIMVPIIFYNLVQHIVAGTIHEVISRRESNLDT